MRTKLLADHILGDGPLKGWRISLFHENPPACGIGVAERVELVKPAGADIDEREARRLNALLKCYEFDQSAARFRWRG